MEELNGDVLRLEEFKSVCRAAIYEWGVAHQSVKLVEECCELSQALCKQRIGVSNLTAIAEEIADVEIMIEQIKHGYKIYDGVEMLKKAKIDRLKEIISCRNGI